MYHFTEHPSSKMKNIFNLCKHPLLYLTIIYFLILPLKPVANTNEKGFAVVELFTSEGCANSPAADKLVNALQAEAEKTGRAIYFLNMHVNYWDDMGWKDPYAKKIFVDRQDNYARFFPGGSTYTPQMIVNGKAEFIGTQKQTADLLIAEGLAQTPEVIIQNIKAVRVDSLTLQLEYELKTLPVNCVFYLAILEKNLPISKVTAGANEGKKLEHYSVVRHLETIETGLLKGKYKINYAIKKKSKNFSIVCFVQNKVKRTIVAARDCKVN